MVILPDEADPPLVIDADGVLSLSAALESFELVARRYTKVIEPPGVIQKTQLPQRRSLNIGWKPSAAAARPNRCCLSVTKADDHEAV